MESTPFLPSRERFWLQFLRTSVIVATTEYATVCLFWASRIVRIEDLTFRAKVQALHLDITPVSATTGFGWYSVLSVGPLSFVDEARRLNARMLSVVGKIGGRFRDRLKA